jgi:hypothetical protein
LVNLLSAGSAVRATGWPILEWFAEALEVQIVGFFVVPALGDLSDRSHLPGGRRPKRNAARKSKRDRWGIARRAA